MVQGEKLPSMTLCSLPTRKALVHFSRFPRIPRSLWCGTESNALEKSRNIAWVVEFVLIADDQSLMICNSWI